jgi:hypothetical protein
LALEAGHFTGPILRRAVVHGYSDVIVDQVDTFYACWVRAFEVSSSGHTPEERLTMTGHRWWSRDELARTGATVWPATLAEIWDEAERRRASGGRGADRPALDGGAVEESSVPVGTA